ncbi:MAG: IS3 family transposase [Verrucomicrobia bacterium]|nr:IS3 family transposase [Verrucomicrobiota bacterium]
MSKKRRQHSPDLKAKVGLEALKGIQPVHAIAAKYQVHPVQVSQWKKEAAERLPEVFARKADQDAQEAKEREKELFEEIGRLKMELEWLKKKLANSSVDARRRMIEPEHPSLPITRQCELLGLARASYYHQPEPESDENLRLMRVIDETYLAHPVYGSRQMTRCLRRQGYLVNRKRVRRLMQQMGLEAIYRKPNLSRKHPQNPVFRYLLRRLVIDRPNQVWAMDITYIPIQGGFIYLCAVIDWYSRAVLAWELSNTNDARFCVQAVERAIAEHGVPEIFNTDQGSQFTSFEFTQPLLARGVKLSMDGRGRALDNVFVERLWRTVKYEEVYLKSYRSQVEAYTHLDIFFQDYNDERPHSAFGMANPKTPMEVYRQPIALAVNQ